MRRWPLLLAMCAGCYGDQLDAPPDAGAIDDPRELVTLQFLGDAVDLAGFPVYFQNADSSLVTATRTNSEGRASALMMPGGFVTIALPRGNMYTYSDVHAGVFVVDERSVDNAEDSIEIEVSIPPSPGATNYAMFTTCGISALDADAINAGMTTKATLPACASTSDVLVTALTSVPFAIDTNFAYMFAKDVPLDASALLTMSGAFVPQISTEVFATSVIDPAPSVELAQLLVRDRHSVSTRKSVTVDVVGGAASGRIARMFAPAEGTTLTRVSPQALGLSGQTTLVWGPSGTATTIPLGERPLRSYTTRPQLDPTTTSVRWNEEPTGEIGDLVLLELSWQPPDARSRVWKILSPRSEATIVRYPLLPVPEIAVAADAWVTMLTTFSVDEASAARTTLLGNWPGNEAWLADTETGRADFRSLVPPLRN